MIQIKPPHSITTKDDTKKIFLAGSIEQGLAEQWQPIVVDEMRSLKCILLNPRRDEWDNSWEQNYRNPNFYQQVYWELNALDKADLIFMYLDPATRSPISLLELGLYAKSGKLIVVCSKSFYRSGNVEIVCEKYNIPLFRELSEGIQHLKKLI